MRTVLSPLLKALALMLLLCTAQPGHAQAITIDLSTLATGLLGPGDMIEVLPGDTIDIFGVLTNTQFGGPGGIGDLVMDSAGSNILGPSSDVTLDDTDFYTNFFLFDPTNPGLIQAQQILPASGASRIFTLTVPLTALPGTYFGTYDIFDADANVLGETPFVLQVNAAPNATPEPTTSLYLLCSASSLFLVLRRKKRAARTV